MAAATVSLTLPQMIDYAVNFPDNGNVNYILIQSVLQVLVQQLELEKCNVEFKGKDGDVVKKIVECTKNTSKLTVKEFVVTPQKDAGKRVNRGKKDADPNVVNVEDGPADLKTVVVLERDGTSDDPNAMILSKEGMDKLKKEIEDLKQSLKELSEMPANRTLIDAIRQSESGKGAPILEVFQSVSLLKRMDATDAQVEKLANMLDELIRSNPNLGCPPGADASLTICDVLKSLDERLSRIEANGGGGGGVDGGDGADGGIVIGDVPDFTNMTLDEFKKAVYDQLVEIKTDLKKLFRMCGRKKSTKEGEGGGVDEDTEGRLCDLESVFEKITEQLASLDTTFNNEFANLQAQFAEMEKEFGSLMEKIHVGSSMGDGQVSGETVGELYEKIMGIQTDMENLAETASKLMEDKEAKEKLMDLLTEQIDLLKTIKADKEELEDALADKADACAINRKVSHDQFDTACDELSKGIEEALAKLTQQEELWQAALDEIQREIGNKLDRMELGPLRDFINQKLKILQQKLKALTALKQENEAAGTKKCLKNVQCISCDKDVVMRKELDPSVLPQPYSLPPTKNMGPYLAYELDALRKQQKALPNSRNLNHFESAMQSKSPKGDDHICNRYCGGSHTITTPQQRVTRLGHFLNQWGPEAQPVCEQKEDDVPLVVTGRGAASDRKGSASKEGAAGDAPPADAKKDVSVKGSKTSRGSKTSAGKVSPKGSATKKPSQTSTKSGGGAKQSSKLNVPEKIPEEPEGQPPSQEAPAEGGAAPAEAPPEGDAAPAEAPPEGGEAPAEAPPEGGEAPAEAPAEGGEAPPAEEAPADAPAEAE